MRLAIYLRQYSNQSLRISSSLTVHGYRSMGINKNNRSVQSYVLPLNASSVETLLHDYNTVAQEYSTSTLCLALTYSSYKRTSSSSQIMLSLSPSRRRPKDTIAAFPVHPKGSKKVASPLFYAYAQKHRLTRLSILNGSPHVFVKYSPTQTVIFLPNSDPVLAISVSQMILIVPPSNGNGVPLPFHPRRQCCSQDSSTNYIPFTTALYLYWLTFGFIDPPSIRRCLFFRISLPTAKPLLSILQFSMIHSKLVPLFIWFFPRKIQRLQPLSD